MFPKSSCGVQLVEFITVSYTLLSSVEGIAQTRLVLVYGYYSTIEGLKQGLSRNIPSSKQNFLDY